MTKTLRGLRGATTAAANTREAILNATAGRGGPGGRADGRTVRATAAVRTVIVSARGAARWQAGHPWIYRTDVYDEPGDTPGIVAVTDRRGRHLGQALYSPKSEIRLRLLTRGREPVDATRSEEHTLNPVTVKYRMPSSAYPRVHPRRQGRAPLGLG